MSKLSNWLREHRILGARHPLAANVTVGRHTYGITKHTVSMQSAEAPLNVGSFCSIAGQVVIMCSGNHSMDCATSFPVHMQLLKRPSPVDNGGRRAGVNIGNDVWVGFRATILPGVSIGHGAVVGAGAVVTRDVPPYAIVAGNPARIIRFRFADEIVSKLLAIRWWEWDDNKIKQEADTLTGPIEIFVAKHFQPAP